VRVSDTPLSKEEGTAVARDLAERYDGDLSSANWRHIDVSSDNSVPACWESDDADW